MTCQEAQTLMNDLTIWQQFLQGELDTTTTELNDVQMWFIMNCTGGGALAAPIDNPTYWDRAQALLALPGAVEEWRGRLSRRVGMAPKWASMLEGVDQPAEPEPQEPLTP